MIRFPSLKTDVFSSGDRVLSLWSENNEWSSMFYEATLVESIQLPVKCLVSSRFAHVGVLISTLQSTDDILRICYEGDTEIYEVPRSKAIKFENKSTRAAQSRGGKCFLLIVQGYFHV